MSRKVVKQIEKEAKTVYNQAIDEKKPQMRFPIRSLANVRYSAQKGHFEMRNKHKERTLTVSTVKTFAQTLRMMALSKQNLKLLQIYAEVVGHIEDFEEFDME